MFGGAHQKKSQTKHQTDPPDQGLQSDGRASACAAGQDANNLIEEDEQFMVRDIKTATSSLGGLASACAAGRGEEDLKMPAGGEARGLRIPSPAGLDGPQDEDTETGTPRSSLDELARPVSTKRTRLRTTSSLGCGTP